MIVKVRSETSIRIFGQFLIDAEGSSAENYAQFSFHPSVVWIATTYAVNQQGVCVADYLRLLALSDDELRRADVVEMNLLVAKSIPALADLDIPRYQRLADEWAEANRERLPKA